MRIKDLEINNFKVIRSAHFNNLSDFVVIAGPNGVGKTKVKDAICYIFQNNGNPPPDCKVVLEATSKEEKDSWGSESIELPHKNFWGFTSKRRKKLHSNSRLIHIDSRRQIDSINFREISINQLGNPEEEEVGHEYGVGRAKDRFNDICNTLHKEMVKLITDIGKEAYQKMDGNAEESVTVRNRVRPTKRFEDMLAQLLYPKKMAPIVAESTTLEYFDEDGSKRSFSELSSGEQEVIVLSFDILLQNPSDCVILIDEPEIHLHPELTFRLIKVLKSIGERNQYFLFTHSTDIIGSSFDTGIYFIRPKSRVSDGNQVVRVDRESFSQLEHVPNLRETIGMVSLGKKLLFVEGANSSIDRNVFSTLARSMKSDLAIVPSSSARNVSNMSLICETLRQGLFGLEIFMIRDRDSLTDEQIAHYKEKSAGKLIFLPFYEMENAFLDPDALYSVLKRVKPETSLSSQDIKDRLTDLARKQIINCVEKYVKNEVYFEAGNFDITPQAEVVTKEDLIRTMLSKRDTKLSEYTTKFNDEFITSRINYWHEKFANSLNGGWSQEARTIFHGSSLLSQINVWLFGSKNFNTWEHMINSEDPLCVEAIKPLRTIVNGL